MVNEQARSHQVTCFADDYIQKNVEKQLQQQQHQQQQQQQQQLAKEVFSPRITKFRRQRIIPLYKDETWSADLIDKSSLSKYNNNCKFILTVIDIFTKYEWAIRLKNKSGLSITNGFKTILSEGRKPEKLCVDRGSEFYNKAFKSLLKEYGTVWSS